MDGVNLECNSSRADPRWMVVSLVGEGELAMRFHLLRAPAGQDQPDRSSAQDANFIQNTSF